MDAAERGAPVSRLERSSHTAFIDDHTLYVWGGYQAVAGEDVLLPSDEIWLCHLDSGMWERRDIAGDKPPDLSGFCGAHVNGKLYIFAGCDSLGYTNQMFSVDLAEPCYSWERVTDTKGTTPSPRNKHSCWVHKDRLIYFGGYGCKTMGEVRNTSLTSFIVEEMSWTTIGNALFRCWGWNNEVNVFDTLTATWSMPETQGAVPAPRGCHASALLGNKGYISGGVSQIWFCVYDGSARSPDLNPIRHLFHMNCDTDQCRRWLDGSKLLQPGVKTFGSGRVGHVLLGPGDLDLDPLSCTPMGRSMFTMTPISDHTLFIYGGLGTDGNTLNDAWHFDTHKREWTKMSHPHQDKPRVCHTACLGSDSDVVVFGGSSNMRILMDSVAILRAPSQNHCKDVFIFQTQPYSLFRLCEDFIGRNPELFGRQLNWLPSKLRGKIDKRVAFFSAAAPATA